MLLTYILKLSILMSSPVQREFEQNINTHGLHLSRGWIYHTIDFFRKYGTAHDDDNLECFVSSLGIRQFTL
jgi:hypothetical protein